MWEERTCRQVRLWQHWGSGCYKYNCHGGRINVIVTNYTFTCYHKDQEIPIKILSDDWLHVGALVCPSCEELCEVSLQIFTNGKIINQFFAGRVAACWCQLQTTHHTQRPI